MPTPQALASLKLLAGNRDRQVMPTEAYQFAGSVPTQGELESPFEQEQARRAERADARDRAAVEQIQNTNANVTEYNRPDVAEIRHTEEKTALERLLAPIRLKGQFDVEAAKQSQLGTAQRDERLFGQKSATGAAADAGKMARLQAAEKAKALRQQYQLTASGKANAPLGFLEGWVPGAQGRANQAALAALQQQIADAEAAGTEPTDDAGVEPVVTASSSNGMSAAELLARRRARGR